MVSKMVQLVLVSALQLICGDVFSQTTNQTGSEPEKPITIVAINRSVEKAAFPGGKESLESYLSKNVRYPKSVRKKKIEGICFLAFTVTSFGNISDVKVMKGVPNCTECDAEALRVVREMPQWVPAKFGDERTDSTVTLHVTFKL